MSLEQKIDSLVEALNNNTAALQAANAGRAKLADAAEKLSTKSEKSEKADKTEKAAKSEKSEKTDAGKTKKKTKLKDTDVANAVAAFVGVESPAERENRKAVVRKLMSRLAKKLEVEIKTIPDIPAEGYEQFVEMLEKAVADYTKDPAGYCEEKGIDYKAPESDDGDEEDDEDDEKESKSKKSSKKSAKSDDDDDDEDEDDEDEDDED